MEVLVTVAEVAFVEEGFEIDDTAIDERYLEYNLNDWDGYALEEAVRLREEGLAEEVVTVTIGPERSEEAIRTALAKGADRAIRVWDDFLEAERLLDVNTKTELLRAVVAEEEPDLILTGVRTADAMLGATGVSLAAAIDYSWAAVVNDLELDGGTASVHRELEDGVEELTDVETPAVLTIQTGINQPRDAGRRALQQAQRTEIARMDLADLGLDGVASDLEVTELSEPEAESNVTILEGNAEDAAVQLASILRENGVPR